MCLLLVVLTSPQLIDKGAALDGKSVLVSSFKNEAPFVLEFVAHHKVVGFDEIVIASNDCDDGTDIILTELSKMGVIHHIPCGPVKNLSPQSAAYYQVRSQIDIDSSSWMMVLDADELLNIHAGQGSLKDLLSEQEDPDLILVNWACFGSGGHSRWTDELSSSKFVRRLGVHQGPGVVKSLVKSPKLWNKISNHHPFGWNGTREVRVAFEGGRRTKVVDGSAISLGAFRDVEPKTDSFELAQVNHYATRTEDSFSIRRSRGRGAGLTSQENNRHTEMYFERMGRGMRFDDTISRYRSETTSLISDFCANPELRQAVEAGIVRYENKITAFWDSKSPLSEAHRAFGKFGIPR